MKFEGDWDDLSTKICLCSQSWTRYLEKSKEIKPSWTRAKKIENCFCLNFDHY